MSVAAPPFSPGLFASLLLRPVPDVVLNKGLAWALRRVLVAHPDIFNRLPENSRGIVVVSLTDLHLDLALDLSPTTPSLRVVTDEDRLTAIAGISGPLQTLIDLMEGRVDGDALFFSRALRFEGDTEIVVALRNTLDGIDIQIDRHVMFELQEIPKPHAQSVGTGALLCRGKCRKFGIGGGQHDVFARRLAEIDGLRSVIDDSRRCREQMHVSPAR